MRPGSSHKVEVPEQLARGSFAILLSVMVNAVGSLVFWIVVARVASPEVVGVSSAMFQTLLFANFVGSVGLPVTIARYATDSSAESTAVANWAVAFRALTALVGALVVLLVARTTGPIEQLDAWGPNAGRLVYAIGAIGTALSVVVEARLVTLRLWGWVIGRAAGAALGRLPLLLIAILDDADTYSGLLLFSIAVGPIAASGFIGALALRLTTDRQKSLVPRLTRHRREIQRFSIVNWFGLLATQGPLFGIPVIVAFATTERQYAPFFIAWSFGAMAFLVPHTISQVALSELGKTELESGRTSPDSFGSFRSTDGALLDRLNKGLRLALILTCVGAVAAWALADTVAAIYGSGYSRLTTHLPLLAGAAIAWAYTAMGLTAARAVDRHRLVVLLSTIFVVATVGPTLVFVGEYGPEAASWAWLGGSTLTAAVTAAFFWQPIREVVLP